MPCLHASLLICPHRLLVLNPPQAEEDDATFWSRLIAEPDRPQEEAQAPLGPRAARSKAPGTSKPDASSPPGSRQLSLQHSDDLSVEEEQHQAPPAVKPRAKKARKAGGGGGGRAGGGGGVSDKPGAPVEGAALRVAQWPLEEGAEGEGKVGGVGTAGGWGDGEGRER